MKNNLTVAGLMILALVLVFLKVLWVNWHGEYVTTNNGFWESLSKGVVGNSILVFSLIFIIAVIVTLIIKK